MSLNSNIKLWNTGGRYCVGWLWLICQAAEEKGAVKNLQRIKMDRLILQVCIHFFLRHLFPL